MFPRMKRFTVVGTFHVGAGEIDGYLGLTNISDLSRLHRWKPDQVQGLRYGTELAIARHGSG